MSVWAHHMFTVGMSSHANTFFVLSTMAIAVPTGIKIFNWLATMWGGKIHFATPMLFCIGFLFQFLIAGLTGIMLASAPFDWQLGNSYFVVAHFHYVIVGGILFALFARILLLVPEGDRQDVQRDAGQAALLAVRDRLPPHVRFHAHPRTAGHAAPHLHLRARPWMGRWNLIVTVGVVFQAAGVLVFVFNLVWSYFRGQDAGNDPWDAWTLEWSTSFAAAGVQLRAIPDRSEAAVRFGTSSTRKIPIGNTSRTMID